MCIWVDFLPLVTSGVNNNVITISDLFYSMVERAGAPTFSYCFEKQVCDHRRFTLSHSAKNKVRFISLSVILSIILDSH